MESFILRKSFQSFHCILGFVAICFRKGHDLQGIFSQHGSSSAPDCRDCVSMSSVLSFIISSAFFLLYYPKSGPELIGIGTVSLIGRYRVEKGVIL